MGSVSAQSQERSAPRVCLLPPGGTNHEGLGPLQDGEVVDFEIHGIGRMRLHVRDPLKRSWEKGIYMGADSTNPEAIKRNRPPPGR